MKNMDILYRPDSEIIVLTFSACHKSLSARYAHGYTRVRNFSILLLLFFR